MSSISRRSRPRIAGVRDAQDGLQDDLHRQVLGRQHVDDVAGAPRIDLLVDESLQQLGVRADALAVEGREQELAALEVLSRLEEEERAITDERPQHVVAVAFSSGAPVSSRRIASRSVVRTSGGYVPGRTVTVGP